MFCADAPTIGASSRATTSIRLAPGVGVPISARILEEGGDHNADGCRRMRSGSSASPRRKMLCLGPQAQRLEMNED
jgi:hypothetical protein